METNRHVQYLYVAIKVKVTVKKVVAIRQVETFRRVSSACFDANVVDERTDYRKRYSTLLILTLIVIVTSHFAIIVWAII